MRLRSLTTLNTALLLGICLALGAALWWSERALSQPYRLVFQVLELSQQFREDVAAPIQGYLASGDAVRHRAAVEGLAAFEQQVAGLPPTLSQELGTALRALNDFVTDELLAVGKLAGDPQALVLQAERDMAAAIARLAEDASAAGTAGQPYHAPLLAISDQLLRLSHARAKYVSTGRDTLRDDVQEQVSALDKRISAAQALPLLGAIDSGPSGADNFAAMMGLESQTSERDLEDRTTAPKRELTALIARYPNELARTRELIERRAALVQETEHRVATLQTALARLEPAVRTAYHDIQTEVRQLQVAMILAIVLIALLADRLQRRLTRQLGQLVPALTAWAGGDFSRPIDASASIDELRTIEESLNRLHGFLHGLIGTLGDHANRVSTSSRTLADLNGHLQDGAQRQADDTAQIRDSLVELEATIEQVATGASQTAAASRDARQAVATGQDVIEQSLNGLKNLVEEVQLNAQAIEHLAKESETIGGVLSIIRSIAEQTNLLALNAAIEAARAGTHGLGFAVVAEEVRTLAKRSSSATDEIDAVISRLQGTARQSVEAMRSQVDHARATADSAKGASGALDGIVAAMSAIGERAEQIAEATAQQHLATAEIRNHGERIHRLGEANLGHIALSRAEGERLLSLARELDAASADFKLERTDSAA